MTIELRAQPRARRRRLACTGQGTLKAEVTAPAEDGQANRAIIELLAGEWRLAKSAFEVTRGVASRDKVVGIAGDPALLAERIAAWVRGQTGDHG